MEAGMNISKSDKFILTALAFVMFMVLAQLPLAAKERRGSTVVVTLILGRGTTEGELLAVKKDALLIYDHDAGRGQRIELQDVFQVRLIKKSKFFSWAAIGLASGFVTAVIQHRSEDRESLLYGSGFIFFPFQFGLLGGIVGAIAGTDIRFPMSGESSDLLVESLNQLKHYARERDVEKPDGPQ
jgi:hypothetical protein